MTRFRLICLHSRSPPGVLAAPVAHAAHLRRNGLWKYCTTCHDATDGHAPTRAALKQMSPARILRT